MEDPVELILKTVQSVAESVSDTTNGIAKIKEIQRTTGITKRQSHKMLRESHTNQKIALDFQQFCEANPGFYFKQRIGNIEMSNLGKILEFAITEFQERDNIPNVQLDNEWLLKFLDTAGQVSDEEKQKIMAKVLAGQLKKPDSISYRTLSILKVLTKKELQIFKKAVSYCFYKPNKYALLLRNGFDSLLTVDEIMYLDECNLLDNSTVSALSVHPSDWMLTCKREYILMTNVPNGGQANIDCFYFTNAALELIPFITTEEVPIIQLKDFILKIANPNISFELHKTLYEENGNLHYNIENLLTG